MLNSYLSQISRPAQRSHHLIFVSILIAQTVLVRSQASQVLTYYVSSSPGARNGWCSMYNCFNLTEIARTISMERSALNISLILLPGNHTLLSNLTVVGYAHFLLKSEESQSRQPIINCGGLSRLQIHSTTNVRIHGIILNECIGNEVKAVDRLTIEDCTLSARGTPSNLSGIVISNSTVAIVGSMLNYFRITQPSGQGGAIHSVYNYVLISNSMFFMNSAY